METAIPMPSYEHQQLVCGPNPGDTQQFESVGRTLMAMLSQVGIRRMSDSSWDDGSFASMQEWRLVSSASTTQRGYPATETLVPRSVL